MINNEMFTNRLQVIFDHYGLSASAFAEKMGVGRSSISHIVSGRNKPSLDFVLHILNNFEEVSFDWLILGKGNFPKNNIQTSPPTLFENQVTEKEQPITNQNTSPQLSLANEGSIINEAPLKTTNSVAIDRIVIFYSDNSFKEYKN